MRQKKDLIHIQLLASRCRRGDRAAWFDLIAEWEPHLFYYVRRLLPREEDAWDVLQLTWVAAYEGINRLTDLKQLAPWLYRIARNKAVDQRRRMQCTEALDGDGDDFPVVDSEEHLTDNVESVHHAMDHLSLSHREVLTLHFLEDLSVEQTAQVLGVPIGTVKSRLHYARNALRLLLEKEVTP